MTLSLAILTFPVLWWLAFMALLPLGIEKPERLEPGQDPGAPKRPYLGRKAIGATLLSALALLLLHWFLQSLRAEN